MNIAAKTILLFLIINCQLSIVNYSSAQCAMCKRAAETNYQQQQAAQRKGRSLNNGILYLLATPYLIGAVGAFVWYKNRKKTA